MIGDSFVNFLIIAFLIAILVLCIGGTLLCTRGDPWEEEMRFDCASTVNQESITISQAHSSMMESDRVRTSESSLPPIDEEMMRVMENDPSGGVVLDRMDRKTAEALAVERILKDGQSSLFNHLALPQPSEVRVVASKRDFL
ncbi:hypothetical protein PMAYCL1PPCAC_18212 [Pristionchus mayeri]|uniref:Uncharacterized protein n=1 Tax=Pristionchus mayeri TaxID=1317129 RepID=A0AAN5CP62_9BILA|nr:hypothetical protein PMAYCL1PPCAC_18212 [Pristionchus mayeri]